MNGSGSAAPSAASASDRNCLMASCSEAAMSSASLRRSWRTASRATLDGCVVANSAATRRATVAVRTLITVPRSTRAKTASTMAMNTPSITGEPVTQAIKAAYEARRGHHRGSTDTGVGAEPVPALITSG